MSAVRWIVVVIAALLGSAGLVWIGLGAVALSRGWISWRVFVGVALTRSLGIGAVALVIVQAAFRVSVRNEAFCLLLLVPASMLWNHFMVRADDPHPGAEPRAPQE